MSRELTLITEAFFRLGKFHLLIIRKYFSRLKIGHEFERIGATDDGKSEEEGGSHHC
jgi:hypothetical protein